MRRRGFLAAAVAAALLPAAVAGPACAEEAERIVIAGGSLTEIAFALGAGDRIVGVDATSNFPPEAKEKAQIGYFRALAPEGLLSLSPDLVIADAEAGPAAALDRVEAAGVPVARAPAGDTARDVPEKIAFMGRVLGLEGPASALADRYAAELAEVRAKVARLPDRPRALFVMTLDGGAPVVGGAGTAADAILTEAGAENAAAAIRGWKPMSREAILAAAPEAVVLMSQRAEALGGAEKALASPGLSETPAARNGRAIAMEGMLLLGFGPRTPEAIARLARALHPETAAGAGF